MKAIIGFILSLFGATTIISPLSRELIPSNTPTPEPAITIGLVGDLGFGRNITAVARKRSDFTWSFQKISPWLLQNDFNLANLESPIIDKCPTGQGGTFIFCGDTRFLSQLQSNKFLLNLNNNHMLNYGVDGLKQTQNFLPDSSFYNNFLIKLYNGISFGFLGFDFITYPKLDQSQIIDKIREKSTQVDWLIVSVHWGNEYLPAAEKWRQLLAHQMIDAGADIIHGHHPHVWQQPEMYQDKPIFYSFGNFIFDQSWSYETSHSQIAKLTLTKNKIINQELFPIAINFNSQPALIP